MKLIRHYELEMTDKELRSFRDLPREGGLAKMLTDMVFGKVIPEDEDYEEYHEEDQEENYEENYEEGCEENEGADEQ